MSHAARTSLRGNPYRSAVELRNPSSSNTGLRSIGSSETTASSPTLAVDDLVHGTPVRASDRGQRTIGRVPEREEPHAEAILGEPKDLPGELLVVERRVAAPDAEVSRDEHHAHRRLPHVVED